MQAVLDFLKQNEKRFVDELCEYVRFPSVSAQPKHSADMQRCAEWVAKQCESIGLRPQICRTGGHPIVLAKTPAPIGGSNRRPHFLVYGHYDCPTA
jgi:acetylornithine deacetylase/succinyl-diaminopimelate desuccinylase-like protein